MSDGEKILYGASKHFHHHCCVLWPLLHRLFPMGTERGKDSVLYFQLASVTFAENNINKNRRIGYGYLFKETFYKHCCFMRLYCWIIVGYYRTRPGFLQFCRRCYWLRQQAAVVGGHTNRQNYRIGDRCRRVVCHCLLLADGTEKQIVKKGAWRHKRAIDGKEMKYETLRHPNS